MAINNNDSNVFQPQMPLFKGENYDFWSIKMKTLFISQDLWDLVENGYTEPADEQAVATWTQTQRDQLKENIKKDSKALFIIQQAVHESIFPRIATTTNSKQAWKLLQNTFQGIVKGSQLMPMSVETNEWLLQAKSDIRSVSRGYDKSTCIFSAPKELLKEYEDAYVPRIVSIGPYYFGKEELKEMESFKSDAVRKEIDRIQSKTGNSDFSFNQVIDNIAGMVGQILRCYDKDIPYDAEVVCWMMARDACFILEFYRCYIEKDVDPLHPIFGVQSENHVVKSEIMRDLIKLENQIPLFVLEEVLAMEMGGSVENSKSKLQILLNAVFNKIYYRPFEYCAHVQSARQSHIDIQDCFDEQSLRQNHILDIYYYCCLGDAKDSRELEKKDDSNELEEENEDDSNELENRKRSKFPSAVQLNIGRVKIRAIDGGRVEDVGFEGRTLSIPRIKLDVESEIFIRNLIALEICSPYSPSKRMTAFAQFMNELCQTEKGTAVMRAEGITVGNLEPSRILQLWNSLKSSSLTQFQPKCHSIHRTRVNLMRFYRTDRSIVCRNRLNKWSEYVGSKKWMVIGGIGATLVFIFTFVQFLCLLIHCPAG